MIDIEGLKSKALAATPGKWIASHGGIGTKDGFKITEYFVIRSGDDIAIASDICDPTSENHVMSAANSAYIAAANPAVMLDLIAELEELRRRK